MYCSEQIVIPEKISNLLKTYAKGRIRLVQRFQHSFTLRSSRIFQLSAIYRTQKKENRVEMKRLHIHKNRISSSAAYKNGSFIAGEIRNVHHFPTLRSCRLCENSHTSVENLQASSGRRENDGGIGLPSEGWKSDKMFVFEQEKNRVWVWSEKLEELHQHMSKIKRASSIAQYWISNDTARYHKFAWLNRLRWYHFSLVFFSFAHIHDATITRLKHIFSPAKSSKLRV